VAGASGVTAARMADWYASTELIELSVALEPEAAP
jgi:hypothetical protein